MSVVAPSRSHVTPIEDSRRWAHIGRRPGDIVIATPPKCGTTWTQRIVMSLLWPADDAPGSFPDITPWVDMRVRPIEEVAAMLDAQTHRRFIKTHSPSDTIPFDPDVRYLAVYREPADALVSWGNHRRYMRPELVEFFNAAAIEDGLPTVPLRFDGDYDTLLVEWTRWWSVAIHLAPWWEHRLDDNVLLLHYGEMFEDLDGQMRRIADFLDIDVPDELWEETVARCRIDKMRAEAHASGVVDVGFVGGADSFFYRGGNGRGRSELSPAQLEAVRAHVEDLLPPAAVRWLNEGGAVV